MIVTEYDDAYLMIRQHDHALVSGELAKQWSPELFKGDKWREQVEYAVSQHDYAWVPLDKKPIWNDDKQQPHSFMDYPVQPKVDHYSWGVDHVQEQYYYAALLCSWHYASFFDQKSNHSTISEFISREMNRQQSIQQQVLPEWPVQQFHFELLQFCDDLSLYMCLNEPGASKENEITMFKDGFRQRFDGLHEPIQAKWLDEQRIAVSPNPFQSSFNVTIPYKQVGKMMIQNRGLMQAFDLTPVEYRTIQLV
ncbi:hypothetical protein ABID56_001903 [Alkalibacillus flavidus]|uniref:DUF3891 family protein n=1 Tax=Alkalibacillus flavidus TaxID=546021 RepID=A0ABV2KW33_9BACI